MQPDKDHELSLQSIFGEINFKKYSAIFGGVFLFGILFGYVLFPSLFKGLIAKVAKDRFPISVQCCHVSDIPENWSETWYGNSGTLHQSSFSD